MRRRASLFLVIAVLLAIGYVIASRSGRQPAAANDPAFQEIGKLVDRVRNASFPQLQDAVVTVHDLRSDYVFLETRFTFSSYFFERPALVVVVHLAL